jgi:hypothetical protein
MILAKVSLSCDRSFIVLDTVVVIVNYDRETFIIEATGFVRLADVVYLRKSLIAQVKENAIKH